MMKFRILALFVFLPSFAVAQVAASDTVGIYRSIYEYSKNRKWLYYAYRAVFNVPADPLKENKKACELENPCYGELAGKQIRNISIQVLDPFGTSLEHPDVAGKTGLARFGNAFHFKTRESIIRNYVQFDEGDAVDPLKFAETERLIRASGFIHDMTVLFIDVPDNPNQVDVTIITRDYWSVSPSFTLSSQKVSVRLTSYSLIGSGQRFSNRVDYRYREAPNAKPYFQGYYYVPTIGNTFISARLSYSFLENETLNGVNFNRPFYSATTRNAGGASYFQRTLNDSAFINNESYSSYNFESGEWSAWLGRSFVISTGKTSEERSTRLVTSTSYTRTRYTKLELESTDLSEKFLSSDLYLGTIGLSNRKYSVDRYIFKFGEKEDVPTGRLFSFTGGYENRSVHDRYYLQIEAGSSMYLPRKGYVAIKAGFGTFVKSDQFSQGIFNASIFGFTRLLNTGGWQSRIFTNCSYLMGINRLNGESIYINDNNGIAGYRPYTPVGTSRLSANIAAVVFNPFDWLGFRISPVVFAGAGLMGNEQIPLQEGKFYKAVGAGIEVTNVYLANSTFRLFFGYYPDIKSDQFRVSSFDIWEYRFIDYDFGKPKIIEFK